MNNISVIKVIDSQSTDGIGVKEVCLKHPQASALMLFDRRTQRNFTIVYTSDEEAKYYEVLKALRHPDKPLMLTLCRNQPIILATSDLLDYVSEQVEWND